MKRLIVAVLVMMMVVAAGCSANTPASKQSADSDFPSKPIEIIVPYAAGGSADSVARILANAVSKYLPNKQSVVVVNKAGGSGVIGATELFKAKPDGYTLAHMPASLLTITSNMGNATFKYDSFQPVMRTMSDPVIFVVRDDAPWKTFEEWVADARANPGKLVLGMGAAGGAQHLSLETMTGALKLDIKTVSFDGGAPLATALLGGHVQGGIMHSADIKPQVDAGKLRVLVNMGTLNDQPHYKNAPFIKDKGVDLGTNISLGLFAPKGLPADVLAILEQAFQKAFQDPEAAEQLKKLGNNLAMADAASYMKEIESEHKTNLETMKKIGLIK